MIHQKVKLHKGIIYICNICHKTFINSRLLFKHLESARHGNDDVIQLVEEYHRNQFSKINKMLKRLDSDFTYILTWDMIRNNRIINQKYLNAKLFILSNLHKNLSAVEASIRNLKKRMINLEIQEYLRIFIGKDPMIIILQYLE